MDPILHRLTQIHFANRPRAPLPLFNVVGIHQRLCIISVIPTRLQPRALKLPMLNGECEGFRKAWRKRCWISSVKSRVIASNPASLSPLPSGMPYRGHVSCKQGKGEVGAGLHESVPRMKTGSSLDGHDSAAVTANAYAARPS